MIETKHLSHYLSLIGILAATFIGFFAFPYDKDFQLRIISSCCLAYFSWGIIHHILHKNLNLEVIIEYACFSLLGFIIAVSVIFRS